MLSTIGREFNVTLNTSYHCNRMGYSVLYNSGQSLGTVPKAVPRAVPLCKKKTTGIQPVLFGVNMSVGLAGSLFGGLHELVECSGIVEGKLGQHFAIDLDTGFIEAVNKLGVS